MTDGMTNRAKRSAVRQKHQRRVKRCLPEEEASEAGESCHSQAFIDGKFTPRFTALIISILVSSATMPMKPRLQSEWEGPYSAGPAAKFS